MIQFWVHGVPAPKGSARAFFVKNLGRSVITNANAKTKPWEQAIRAAAIESGCTPELGAVTVEAEFYFPRPKGHFGARGLKDSAPRENTKKPDVDKLVRALLDALTGQAFVDDAQVIQVTGRKHYCPSNGGPGASVTIRNADANAWRGAGATPAGGIGSEGMADPAHATGAASHLPGADS